MCTGIPTKKYLEYKIGKGKRILLPTFSPAHGLGGGSGIYTHFDIWNHSDSVLFSIEHLKKRKDNKFSKIKEKTTTIADSGGYSYVSMNELPIDYKNVLEHQLKLDVDIGLTLDFPIDLQLNKETNLKRMEISIENARRASYLLKDDGIKADMKLFACMHGFDKESMKYYVNRLLKDSSDEESFKFDGYAIGSPIHSRGSFNDFIEIAASMMDELEQYGELTKPVHLLGTASIQKILPLVYIGVKSFDSAAPIFAGMYREYYSPDFRRQKIGSLKELKCECPICQKENIIQRMKENTCRGAATIALHNFFVIRGFFEKMRESIIDNEFDSFVKIFSSKYNYKRIKKYMNLARDVMS